MITVIFLLTVLSNLRTLIQAQPRKPQHQGGRALLAGRDVLLFQPELATTIGDSDSAIIVQKLHEWLQHNERENKHATHFKDGKWWTYNDLETWRILHFSWMSISTLKRKMSMLAKAGFIFRCQFGQGKGDNRYWYSLNYAALIGTGLVSNWHEGDVKVESTPSKMTPARGQTGTLTNRESATKKAQLGKRKPTTTSNSPLSVFGEAQGVRSDVDVVETPIANQGEFSPDTAGVQPSLALEPKDAAPDNIAQSGEPNPSPSSAAPLPTSADALVETMVAAFEQRDWYGEIKAQPLTPKTAVMWIKVFGEQRVQSVFEYARANKEKLSNPPGFMLDELRHDRLGLSPSSAAPLPTSAAALDMVPAEIDTEADEPLYRILAREMAREGN